MTVLSWETTPEPQLPQVYEPHLRVEVYDRLGTTKLSELPRRFGSQGQEPLNVAGMGKVSVLDSDPVFSQVEGDLFTNRNVVKFFIGSHCVSAFRIREDEVVQVSSDEAAAIVRTVSGPTLLDMLGDTTVRHEDMRPDSLDTRYYSWASRRGEWYELGDWNENITQSSLTDPPGGGYSPRTPVKKRAKYGQPTDWPEYVQSAKWIWPAKSTEAAAYYGGQVVSPTAHTGNRFFRKDVVIDKDNTLVRVYATADEWFRLYIDGEEVVYQENYEVGFMSFVQRDYTLSKGTHTFAVHNRAIGQANVGDGNDAFLFALVEMDIRTEPIRLIAVSNSSWEAHYGTPPPGWHRAEVLRDVLAEAKQRGVTSLLDVEADFGAKVDSDGVAWTDVFSQAVQIGTSGTNLLEQLVEGNGFDVWLDPADMKLKAWNRRGVDRSVSVALRPGVNLIDATHTKTDEVVNDFLVHYDGGFFRYTLDDSIEENGRTEAYVELGNTKDEGTARRQIKQILDGVGRVSAELGVSEVVRKEGQPEGTLIAVEGMVPFVDYQTGDVVTALNEKREERPHRVMSLTFSEDEAGKLSFDYELQEVYSV